LWAVRMQPMGCYKRVNTGHATLRHRTATVRTKLSKPARTACDSALITVETAVLDYGCGRGDDIRALRAQGIKCTGWDPAFFPDEKLVPTDVVNLGYVVNVIEDPAEREDALRRAWGLARQTLIVSARLKSEAKRLKATEFSDGVLSSRGTFQKFYTQSELRGWIDGVLGIRSLALAPGIFCVFRHEEDRQRLVASLYRRKARKPTWRQSEIAFEQHKGLLKPLMDFMASRGRLPLPEELAEAPQISEAFGSLKRAFSVVKRVTGAEYWDLAREDRSQDLLVYLALAQFGGRPKASQLPAGIRQDVKAFFSVYSRACEQADKLLYSAGDMASVDRACQATGVGKLMPNALYVHTSLLPQLDPLLRVYEGCARNYVGVVKEANIIKLNRRKPKVSYLFYPNFDKDPHPALLGAVVVPLQGLDVKFIDYSESENPPILHRKETFVGEDYPAREKFAKLTRQEEKLELYANTAAIGTRGGWEGLLACKGLRQWGHRIVEV